MTDEEIFDNETKSMGYTGGRWPYEQLPTLVKSEYMEIADRAIDLINSALRAFPNLPPIHFDFIHDGKVNALSFKAKGRYFIGLTTGAVYMLRMVIGRIMADRDTFDFVGQPSLEECDLRPVLHYVADADAMHDQQTAILTPNCNARASYAWFLQDQAIMFLVGHEIAHITRGHVDYLTSRAASFTLPSGWSWNKGKEASIERQCLEINADQGSIVSRINSLRVTYSNPEQVLPPWSPVSYHAGHLIRDWSVSLNIVFRLFGDIRFSRSELNRFAYPPIPVRRVFCEMTAYGVIQEIWDAVLEKVAAQSLADGRNYLEYAFAQILNEPVSTVGLITAFTKMSQDHMQRLVDHWNDILRPLVEPFSYE